MNDNIASPNNNKARLQLNTWLLPFIVCVFSVLYAITGFRGWFVLVIGFASVWLLALLWVIALRNNLYIERNLHLAWAKVGDSVHEELKLVNNSWLPALWVEVTDTSAMLSTSVRMVSDVSSKSTRTRTLNHLCRHRGLYTLGPTCLRTGDPFGIYTLTFYDQHSDTILVTPPVISMKQIKVKPADWAGDHRRQRGALERDISDVGVRNYIPGDSLKRIHWRASAHFDTLIVRQLETSASGDWWIFVDLQDRVQAGEGRDSSLELSIVLAASLAMRGLREHRRVGIALAGPDLVWLEPRADPSQRWHILRALAMAGIGERSIADLILLRSPVKTSTMIAITPSTDPTWVAALSRNRGGGQLALLVDPAEFGNPIAQNRVESALGYCGIPYYHASRSLLEQAYPSIAGKSHMPGSESDNGVRYLKDGRSPWQRMN